jgi:hypothetical protein
MTLLVGAGAVSASCIVEPETIPGVQSFDVRVSAVNGADPPPEDARLPANTGDVTETLQVDIVALDPTGAKFDFDGLVRISVEPGAVLGIIGEDGALDGRNVRLKNGKARVDVQVTAVYGDTHIVVEDLGYRPARSGRTPECANGENDDPDEDVLVDFPADPGCAFADDDSEESGSFAAGTSQPVHFALPTLRQIQGGSGTPFPYEGLEAKADAPQYLVITRISKDGFFVTDLADQALGYNHMYAFSFSTPPGIRVCDRVVYLAGTMSEFFGLTEMNFPSFRVDPLFVGDEENCLVPEPVILDSDRPEFPGSLISNRDAMEAQESGLVRVEGFSVTANFGPEPAIGNVFGPDKTSCDLNGDGLVDFTNDDEASCGNLCSDDPECTEWTQYVARGNYKIHRGGTMVQVQTDGAPGFNPVANKGQLLRAVTGTLRNFSGGSLNWTIEARCPADLVCDAEGCTDEIKPSNEACVSLRPTDEDNDEGTN